MAHKTNAVKIRLLKPTEAGGLWKATLKRADKTCFPGDARHKFSGKTWVILIGDKLAGYACTKSHSPHTAFLDRYGILPRYRGQGLQTKLLKKCLDWHRNRTTKQVVTYTKPENAKSTNSLLKIGFKPYWPRAIWASKNVVYLILRQKCRNYKKS